MGFQQIWYVHWYYIICFGIANGQILPIFDRVICPQHGWGAGIGLADIIISCFYLVVEKCAL